MAGGRTRDELLDALTELLDETARVAEQHAAGTVGVERDAQLAAPEVLAGGGPSPSADVYALGARMFQRLCGRPPFQRGSDESIEHFMARVFTEPVPDLRRHGMPAAICEVIEKALAKSASRRQASAVQLHDELAAAVRELRSTEPARPQVRPVSLVALAAATLAIATVAGALVADSPGPAPARLSFPHPSASSPTFVSHSYERVVARPEPRRARRGGRDRVKRAVVALPRRRRTITTAVVPRRPVRTRVSPSRHRNPSTPREQREPRQSSRGERQEKTATVVATLPLYHLWHAETRDHFYTTDDEVVQKKTQRGYRLIRPEGHVLTEEQKRTVPLSVDNAATALGFIYTYARDRTKPLYYLRHRRYGDLLTSDATERERAVDRGWVEEGVVGYVVI